MFNFLRRKNDRTTFPDRVEWLVIGLGNPGAQYEMTKHNVGFMAANLIAPNFAPVAGVRAEFATVDNMVILKPLTFMNSSGEAVAPVAKQLGLGPEHIVVIHDELDLAENKVRLKFGGNENGHNGLKSISQALGTRDYYRVRLGIGRPPHGVSVPDWVLGPVGDNPAIDLAAEGAKMIVRFGLAKAQNDIHARPGN